MKDVTIGCNNNTYNFKPLSCNPRKHTVLNIQLSRFNLRQDMDSALRIEAGSKQAELSRAFPAKCSLVLGVTRSPLSEECRV